MVNGLLLFVGCSSLNWTAERLPMRYLDVERVVHLEGDEVLVGGTDSRDHPHDAQLFLRTAPNTYELVWRVEGANQIADITRTPDTLWMVAPVGLVGSSQTHVYCSEDEGRTWTERHVLPHGGGGSSIDVAPDGALWIRGSRTLIRSTDHGRSWLPVAAPSERNGLLESFHLDGDEVVLTNPDTILRTTDGTHWTSEPASFEIRWMDDRFVGGTREGKAVFGPRDGPIVEVDPEYSGWLLTAAADGDEVWALVAQQFSGFGHDVAILHSSDAGRTWTEDSTIMASALMESWSIDASGHVYSGSIFQFGVLWVREPLW